MKTFNRETLKSWIIESFDWNHYKKEYDLSTDAPVFWDRDYEEPELDSLYIGEEAVFFDIHKDGYQLDYWPCDKEGHELPELDTAKYVGPRESMPWLLAKFVPENYQEIQDSVEHFVEQKAKTNLKDYMESD